MGRPPKPQPVVGQKRTAEQSAAALPEDAWCELTIGQGAQGARRYLFARERIREALHDVPGTEAWLVHRRNLDGSEPRYYLSNGAMNETLLKLACIAGSRWKIETEFEETKGHVGLDEYEVRGWHCWHHHIALCLLANAFLLIVQQDTKKNSLPITRPQAYRIVRELLPRKRCTRSDLTEWLAQTQLRNERAAKSHEKRRKAERAVL